MSPRKSAKPVGRAPRVDIHAVAKKAEVSVATVSRAVNRIPTVAPEYARRVWDAIQELGYVPNTQARSLGSGRSRIIGIIISDITNPFFPELIQSFEEEAVEANYELLIGSTGHDKRRMEICVERMLQRKVDGVAVMTFGTEEPLLGRLAAQSIPLVFVDAAPDRPGMSAIQINYSAGIREAVLHLVSLGHRRLAFIAGPQELHSAQIRKKAFLQAVAEYKIKVPKAFLFDADHTLEGGMAGMRHLLNASELPTAVLCSNDMTAIGVLHAAAEAKLRIPQDISVVGFDDIHIARFTVPPLTTVRMSCQELARSAFKVLRFQLENGELPAPNRMEVGTQLKLRESTGKPRKAKS